MEFPRRDEVLPLPGGGLPAPARTAPPDDRESPAKGLRASPVKTAPADTRPGAELAGALLKVRANLLKTEGEDAGPAGADKEVRAVVEAFRHGYEVSPEDGEQQR